MSVVAKIVYADKLLKPDLEIETKKIAFGAKGSFY
jgi:hypothetical protein